MEQNSGCNYDLNYSILPPSSYFASDYSNSSLYRPSENPFFNPALQSSLYPSEIEMNLPRSFNPDPPSPPYIPEEFSDTPSNPDPPSPSPEEQTNYKYLKTFLILSIIFCFLSIFFWFFEIIPAIGTFYLYSTFKGKQTNFEGVLCVTDIIVTSLVCIYYFFIFFAIMVVTMGFGLFTSGILLVPYVAVIIACVFSLSAKIAPGGLSKL